MSGCFVAFAIALRIRGLQDACTAPLAGIVLVTWASAIDYFIVGLRDLR